MGEFIITEKTNHVLVIAFTRAQAVNTFHTPMIESEDAAESVRSLKEKRKAHFTGR